MEVEKLEYVKKMIAEANLGRALSILLELKSSKHDDIVLLSSRYHYFKEKVNGGTLLLNEETSEFAKISKSIISMTSQIEYEYKNIKIISIH